MTAPFKRSLDDAVPYKYTFLLKIIYSGKGKIMKKIACMVVVLCLLTSLTLSISAADDVKVYINSQNVEFDVPPIIQEGRTLVPLRAVFEGLGCDVYWLDEFQIIGIVKNDIKIFMCVGFDDFYKYTGYDVDVFILGVEDTEQFIFDVPPQVMDGRTLIPLRAVSEVMGVDVGWDNDSQTVSLTCDDEFILEANEDKTFADEVFAYFLGQLKEEDTDMGIISGEHVFVEIIMEDEGRMVVELMPEYAPKTVANFVKLVNEEFYDGLTFHRIIKGFMIQGGDPLGTGTGGSDTNIVGEFAQNGFSANTLLHKRGVISMARSSAPNSASSQFFIMHEDSPHLDGSYAAFGVLTEGFEVLDKIANVTVGSSDKPVSPVVMKTVRVME